MKIRLSEYLLKLFHSQNLHNFFLYFKIESSVEIYQINTIYHLESTSWISAFIFVLHVILPYYKLQTV